MGPEDKKDAAALWGGGGLSRCLASAPLLFRNSCSEGCGQPSPTAEQHGALGIREGLPSKGPRAGVPAKDNERPRLWEAGVRNVSSVFTSSLIL